MEFIAVGKCLKARKEGEKYFYDLHFKGFLRDSQIKKIELEGMLSTQELWISKEYIIHAALKFEKNGVLHAKIKRIKEVEIYRSDFL